MTQQSLADLHERIGRGVADSSGKVRVLERTLDVREQPLRGLQIDAAVRSHSRVQDVPINTAIDADWQETERLLSAAYKRLQGTLRGCRTSQAIDRAKAAYRAETRQIIQRDAA